MVILDRDSGHRLNYHHEAPALAPGLTVAPMPPAPPTPPAEEKPYHAKRPHRKSRLGCRNCKTRKVKCDEKKPSCKNCSLRKETCVYPDSAQTSSAVRSTSASASSASASPHPRLASIAVAASRAAASAVPTSNLSFSAHASQSVPRRVVPVVSTALTPVSPAASSAATSTPVSLVQRSPRAPLSGSRRGSQNASPTANDDDQVIIVDEPPFKFAGADEYDMKLLWFYTTETYASFSVETGKLPYVDHILKSQIVKYAFQSPFLMDCILGLSALHMQALNVTVPLPKALNYRARAFAGYRQAIERAEPRDFPALLSCSLLLCALSSELFREDETKPLYIIDWMVVWRGIGLIFDIIPGNSFYESGLDKLFARPAFDLNKAALNIPTNLFFMIAFIKEGDNDHPHISAYYDTLKFLGGLYLELEDGFSPLLSLRVITWFTFLPKPFIELVRKRRPRALVILAHYLPFLKLIERIWWLLGIADRATRDIIDYLDHRWQSLLAVPRAALGVCDRVELAKLIKGNHAWEPPSDKAEHVPDLLVINDEGNEVAYDEEKGWVPIFHVTSHAPWEAPSRLALPEQEPGSSSNP